MLIIYWYTREPACPYFSPVLLAGTDRGIAETLQQLLDANHVPAASFTADALAASVQGTATSNGSQVFVAYTVVNGDSLVGTPHLFRYDQVTGALANAHLALADFDVCRTGAITDLDLLPDFALLATNLTPSAGCLLVFDNQLNYRQTLYGFARVQIAPGLLVLIEDMIHFAPVHPERLQLADLKSGKTSEMYPPASDRLRARLARENRKYMPPQETCMRMNDPCDPDKFDEDIHSVTTDGDHRFRFVAHQSANHAVAEGEPPKTFASQSVLYVYRQSPNGWLYCELLLSAPVAPDGADCTPDLPVVPDMKSADLNPFLNH